MKRWILAFLVFPIALLIGLFAFHILNSQDDHIELLTVPVPAIYSETEPSEMPTIVSKPSSDGHDFVPELTNVKVPEEFENGDFYHVQPVFGETPSLGSCDITPEMSGSWLGLFRVGNRYETRKLKVRFGQYETDDFGLFRPMYFGDTKNAVFLVNDRNEIRPGQVETLYETPVEDNNNQPAGAGFRREVEFGKRGYVVRVTSGSSESGEPLAVLVLESEGKQDILFYSSQRYSDRNIGELRWLGDLDRDKKLDILFSFFAQNGGQIKYILFLSSKASDGHLVQPFAFYDARFRGC